MAELTDAPDLGSHPGQASNSSKSLGFAFPDRYLRDTHLCTELYRFVPVWLPCSHRVVTGMVLL